MNELRKNKAILRDWMRANYTDAKLVELLTHARNGRLSYDSCCCFIGIVTANHELRGPSVLFTHYVAAKNISGAHSAERAFLNLMVKAEIRRRMRLEQQQPSAVGVLSA